jgi:uncharacterized membrane protein
MPTDNREDVDHMRRSYRLAFFVAVALAVVGAPLLMQGVVALVTGFSDSIGHPAVEGIALFSLSALPMLGAWFAWRRTQNFQRFLDQRS